MRAATKQALRAAGLDPADVLKVIRRGIAEDLGTAGDITSTATVAADARLTSRYVSRSPGVIAGMPVLAAVVDHQLGTDATLTPLATDGDRLTTGQTIATIEASARGLLAIERLSLNLLGHLSGIATATRAWVDAVAGTPAQIRDTRKTTPGLRDLEKYAVRCGGGVNHRRGLDGGVLVKDNHVSAAGGVAAALERVREARPAEDVPVQIEVDDMTELFEALANGAPAILLDNFSNDELADAVAFVRRTRPDVVIEASGGLSLERAASVAATGVDYLAVGGITHSAPVLDIGLDS
ncbi:MAG TPA: carboxylating nicotinate-nucleotide diphosphorylase [Mycobacteriales bacterium]|jgi:nicotinate-nucleotide pyrophosphorylase (carboxylating)|nr:carboxylating nicotinate-nucleotide diphosphorylase [Mycobacteriales bacterium]